MGLLNKIEEKEKNQEPKSSLLPESDLPVETDIDKIHSIVLKCGSIAIKDIAVILKADAKRVEELAKILDKYKMAELYYPPVGAAVLRKTGLKDKNEKNNRKISPITFGLILLIFVLAAIILLKIYGVL